MGLRFFHLLAVFICRIIGRHIHLKLRLKSRLSYGEAVVSMLGHQRILIILGKQRLHKLPRAVLLIRFRRHTETAAGRLNQIALPLAVWIAHKGN